MNVIAQGWLPADRYSLQARLGAGGMGEVWLAQDLRRGHAVAVKRLFIQAEGGSAGGEAHRLRFKREFLILSRLNTPGIVRAFDYGEYAGGSFYTMERIAGVPLRDALPPGSALAHGPADAATLARLWPLADQLFTILSRLHGEGLVHRDLKPANLMVAPDGQLTLIDFGLARESHESEVPALAVTAAGEVLGTPGYLAPEQIRGLPLDGRTDLYAVGVILYELGCGRLPFAGRALADTLLAHLQNAPEPPRVSNPALSPAHAAFILRLLAKAPGQRFASAGDARSALAACGETAAFADMETPTAALMAPVEGAAAGLLVAPFIGNESARAALRDSIAALARGEGGLLVLTGASGLGKSMLLGEARADAAATGARLSFGHGVETGGMAGALLYGVFADYAARFAARPALAVELLGEDGPPLAALFPVLRRFVAPDAVSASESAEPDAVRTRLLGALYGFFSRAAAKSPLALVLDDLQWADPLSLDLLSHLGNNFCGGESGLPPLLIITACQDGEKESPAARWMARLPATAHRAALAPLPPEKIGELVQALLGAAAPPPIEFSRRLNELTGGNSFFTGETLRALIAGGALRPRSSLLEAEPWNFSEWLRLSGAHSVPAGLPGSVQLALLRQLDALPVGDRPALEAAALIAGEFPFAWWLEAAGLGEDALLEIADRAIRLGLLRETGRDRLRFAHEQLRTALGAGISELRGRRLHARMAVLLAAQPGEAHADLLVEHALRGAVRPLALTHGHAAARRLISLGQYEAVERLLARINELFTAEDLMAPAERLRHEQLRLTLLVFRGNSGAAIACAQEAIKLAQTEKDAAAEQTCWLELARAHRAAADYPAALEAAMAGLSLARERGDAEGIALALIRAASGHLFQGDYEPALASLREARETAQRAGNKAQLIMVAQSEGFLYHERGDFAAAHTHFTRVQEMAEALGNRHERVRAINNLAAATAELGNLREAERMLRESLGELRAIGDRRLLANTAYNLASIQALRGESAQALAMFEEALGLRWQLGDRAAEGDIRVQQATALMDENRLAEAHAALAEGEAIARELSSPVLLCSALSARADLLLQEKQFSGAARAADETAQLAQTHTLAQYQALAAAQRALAECFMGRPPAHPLFTAAIATAESRHGNEQAIRLRGYYAQALIFAGEKEKAAQVIEGWAARAETGGFIVHARRMRELARACGTAG